MSKLRTVLSIAGQIIKQDAKPLAVIAIVGASASIGVQIALDMAYRQGRQDAYDKVQGCFQQVKDELIDHVVSKVDIPDDLSEL